MFPARFIRRTFGRVRDGESVGGTGVNRVCRGSDPIQGCTIGGCWTGLNDWTRADPLGSVQRHRNSRFVGIVTEGRLVRMSCAIVLAVGDLPGERTTTTRCFTDIRSFPGTTSMSASCTIRKVMMLGLTGYVDV